MGGLGNCEGGLDSNDSLVFLSLRVDSKLRGENWFWAFPSYRDVSVKKKKKRKRGKKKKKKEKKRKRGGGEVTILKQCFIGIMG